MATRERVLSGMRPTGRLHLGHYLGALKNWVRSRTTTTASTSSADWHALTTAPDDARDRRPTRSRWSTDWLAAGLDPERSTLFIQSRVPEHAELHLLLSMITPLGWLERVPTYKDQHRAAQGQGPRRPTASSAIRCCRRPTS